MSGVEPALAAVAIFVTIPPAVKTMIDMGVMSQLQGEKLLAVTHFLTWRGRVAKAIVKMHGAFNILTLPENRHCLDSEEYIRYKVAYTKLKGSIEKIENNEKSDDDGLWTDMSRSEKKWHCHELLLQATELKGEVKRRSREGRGHVLLKPLPPYHDAGDASGSSKTEGISATTNSSANSSNVSMANVSGPAAVSQQGDNVINSTKKTCIIQHAENVYYSYTPTQPVKISPSEKAELEGSLEQFYESEGYSSHIPQSPLTPLSSHLRIDQPQQYLLQGSHHSVDSID